jgi:ferredoxin-NADP reductase
MSAEHLKIPVRVSEVTAVNALVTRFTFSPIGDAELPTFSGGSHVIVEFGACMNPYSLMSSPFDTRSYSISVRRDDAGRGGSLYLHKNLKVGDEGLISHPLNLFPLNLRARKHLFLAGGIGITPFIAQMAQLSQAGQRATPPFELHFCAQSAGLAAYADALKSQYAGRVTTYFDDQNQKLELAQLLQGQPLGTHVYVCGPTGMIDWVRKTAASLGWPDKVVHFEHFSAPQAGAPFDVHLARSGRSIRVSERQSFLEALEAAQLDPPYLCRGGACGQCEAQVLACDGTLEHRDHWLSDEEHASGQKIMPCVSRIRGRSITIDR